MVKKVYKQIQHDNSKLDILKLGLTGSTLHPYFLVRERV